MGVLFNDQTFKKSLKLYKKSPINDRRVFNIIEIVIGDKEGNLTNLHDEVTIIDENLLSKNEKDISFKLSKIKENKGYLSVYGKLKEKFTEYKKLVEDYDKLSTLFHKCHGVNIGDIREKHKILTNKIIYSLIELKVNLGLDLHDISMFDIMWYCMLMYNDITSSNYQTLSIDQHLDSETGEFYIDKQNLKRKSLVEN